MGDAQPKSAEEGVGWGETPHASSSHGIGGLGESEGERCLCITISPDVSLYMYIIHWRCG
jgi:hypothetical protein